MSHFEQNLLAKTRAEEFDSDVWGSFYIPPYFHKLSLRNATKSTYIVGKRGSGKTMLLKYLDYHTSFSKRRSEIGADEISHIGIYWRVDTQFANSLNLRGIPEDEWIQIFDSYFSLVIAVEIIRSLKAIAISAYQNFTLEDYIKFKFTSITEFHSDYPDSLDDLEAYLEAKRRSFSNWISNIATTQRPMLPPGKAFVETIISNIKETEGLAEVSFFVYLDEVENLVRYQKTLLNTYLKHSQRPFIVCFASKELSRDTSTVGSESVNATHDYTEINLDKELNEDERKLFFSEVFLANMDSVAKNNNSPLLQNLLSLDQLHIRNTDEYRDKIFQEMNSYFPSKTSKEVASEAFENKNIFNKLGEKINKALDNKQSNLRFEDFLEYKDSPDAIFILPALLNRHKNVPETLLLKLKEYSESSSGPFVDWLQNNLFGALLEAYRPYNRECSIYSGLTAFFTMANTNLRHFLILCYKAIEVAELLEFNVKKIEPNLQARAARDAADRLIGEIRSFSPHGEALRRFVLRLGGVFRALQARPAMSEPEQNQFTINSGRVLSEEENTFLSEAVKHGVLIEQLGNKTKSTVGIDIVDFQLNPIYAPYFLISYRRKRKLELSVEDFHSLAFGSEDDFNTYHTKVNREEGLHTQQANLWE